MSASFKKVALVTFAALTVIVSIMVGLDALGIAQVIDRGQPRVVFLEKSFELMLSE